MKFGMKNTKPAKTSISSGIASELDKKTTELLEFKQHNWFWYIISCLMFLVIEIWSDIAFVVSQLSQYLSEFCDIHIQAAKHVLHYLVGMSILEILYKSLRQHMLYRYADAAYANIRHSKSTSDNCFLIANESVTWSSKKQLIITQSTTESEYIFLVKTVKQAIWLCHLLYMIHRSKIYEKKLTKIYRNNQKSIDLIKNPIFHAQSKHIQIRYHVIRENVEREKVKIKYQSTDEILADNFIKRLNHIKFSQIIEELNLTNWLLHDSEKSQIKYFICFCLSFSELIFLRDISLTTKSVE